MNKEKSLEIILLERLASELIGRQINGSKNNARE